jgi:hypothetical protein
MSTVSETIPSALQPDVDAALEWFNRDQAIPFEVTGILDPEAALESDVPRELKLVLCGGDRCEQRSFRIAKGAAGREVGFLEDAAPVAGEAERLAELDPPPGPRRGWLDRTLDRHDFTVVLFYRGFW